MPFQLSPGVTVLEQDLTTVVPAVSTTIGGFAGQFRWGPAEQVTSIDSENTLVATFGAPNDAATANSFFTAANFLSYGNQLLTIRAINASSTNAVANANTSANVTADLIRNSDVFDTLSSPTNAFVSAKYPGVIGNSLRIAVADGNSFVGWQYSTQFDAAPGTSTYARSVGGSNDELHVIVVDEDGLFTGTANTVIERFSYLSKASDAVDSSGASIYYRNVLNNNSKYVWWRGHPFISGSNWGNAAVGLSFSNLTLNVNQSISLTGGSDAALTDANFNTSYRLLNNSDLYDVSLIMMGAANSGVITDTIDNVAESRKDCLVFFSPTLSDAQSTTPATNITNYRNNTINRSSSYAVMDSGWKYQYDRYNDVYRWIPLNGDIAGLCARTDFVADPWFSPAGLNRGQIKNIVRLAYNPSRADRDTLYKNGVNPVISMVGQGTVLFGDKTLLSKPSAFDRINVRRLFIVLQKAISTASRYSLFELNDNFTRAQFRNLVEPFLRDVKGRRGITDYRVVCDTSNNTPEVIDRNEFVADIYIKPARSINYINLNFIATRTGVSFNQVAG